MFGLDPTMTAFLVICLVAVFAFEFINGFHDTANAVATVIYTNSLKPQYAVVFSGMLNFLGVMIGGVGVAMGIVELMPMDAMMSHDVNIGLALILATLISSIVWNLGTWYFGIPCSSSHTLVGSIIGSAMGYAMVTSGDIDKLPWTKVKDIGLSLLVSPFVGFSLAFLMVYILKKTLKDKNEELFQKPDPLNPPPTWIRILLILTCGGVSFAHGSNDGQKGVGLTMLALLLIVPGSFMLNNALDTKKMDVTPIVQVLSVQPENLDEVGAFADAKHAAEELDSMIKVSGGNFNQKQAAYARKHITKLKKSVKKLDETSSASFSKEQMKAMKENVGSLTQYTEYAPQWVILMISLALGIGTMIGWKRIVVTIGQKIGKDHLTYAQGASAELVAASTIGLSTLLKLPVSTTHILSSGVAGSMVASKGLKNLQRKTLRNIALAWVLTLPVCVGMSLGLFYLFFYLF